MRWATRARNKAAGALAGMSTATSECDAPAAISAWAAGSEKRSAANASSGPTCMAARSNRPLPRVAASSDKVGPTDPTGATITSRSRRPRRSHHWHRSLHASPSAGHAVGQPLGRAGLLRPAQCDVVGRGARRDRCFEVCPSHPSGQLEVGEHRGRVEQAVEGGVRVVHEPGDGELGAVDRPAGDGGALEDVHLPTGAGQGGRGHEPVRARADDDGVGVVHDRSA